MSPSLFLVACLGAPSWVLCATTEELNNKALRDKKTYMAGTYSGLCSSNITTLPGWDTSPQHYAASICLLRVFTVPSF